MENYRITKKNELYHYGVKGMHWGQRKARETNPARTAAKTEKRDVKMAKKANARINSGEQAKLISDMYKQSAAAYAQKGILKGKDYTKKFAYKNTLRLANKYDAEHKKQYEKAEKYVAKMSDFTILGDASKSGYYGGYYNTWTGNVVLTKKQVKNLEDLERANGKL